MKRLTYHIQRSLPQAVVVHRGPVDLIVVGDGHDVVLSVKCDDDGAAEVAATRIGIGRWVSRYCTTTDDVWRLVEEARAQAVAEEVAP